MAGQDCLFKTGVLSATHFVSPYETQCRYAWFCVDLLSDPEKLR